MSNSEPTEDLNKMCGKGANEVPKLETVYTFTNFGRNYHRMVESFGRTVATGQYSARESCYKIFEDLLQVTEAQFISSSELIDPESKVHLESARLNNGVTSFGSGPDDTKRMLVFEVRQTDITFKKSQHAITMPIVGGCFCALGNSREVFPGPMFPMSHSLYGIGSEMLAASDCCISDTLSMQLKAEFVNSSWFSQLFQHRIVLPGMALSEFLSLSLQISDLKNDDKSRAELFFISNVRVELQEFTSVSKDGLMSKDTRSITIVESKPDCRVPIGTFADHSFFLGEEKLPFMTRVTEREYGHSGRFLPLEHAAVTFAGTRLSAFMKIEMISAVGFEEANRKKPMKDVWIQLEHIEIELIELRRLQRRSDYETTVLLHKDLNPLTKPFMWSKFGDRTPGNLRARSMTLPEEVFDCKIPDNVEPYLFCPMSQMGEKLTNQGT
ncbi:hypothetical protein CA3LBN_001924 [Candidozyma haemuli]|uniref:Uncharacterized protein n=1 Tax=Candidozyma haemuli TaxID=45357 RepID=A0ABX8I3F4_9ASCO|nr:hypothetical protein CA3LBN_001924 [[Candida] haemuloni]